MNWYLIDSNNIVQNSIVYDGHSQYTPPNGWVLKSSNKNYQIGDTFND